MGMAAATFVTRTDPAGSVSALRWTGQSPQPVASRAASVVWTAARMGGEQVSEGRPPQQQLPRAARGTEDVACRASDAMQRYASGDEAAFDELYALLAPRLYRLCLYLQGRADAADLLQEVMLKMHRYRYQFTPGGNVISWAYAITRTTAIDRQRRRRRRPEDVVAPSHWDQLPEASASNPEAVAVGGELEATLLLQLDQLSERQRSAYVLVRLEGLSMAEAGRILGATQATIKQRVHRASVALKVALSDVEP